MAAAEWQQQSESPPVDDTGGFDAVADEAVRGGLLLQFAEAANGRATTGLLATAVMALVFARDAPPLSLVAFLVLRAATTAWEYRESRAVVAMGPVAAIERGYYRRMEVAVVLGALSWGYCAAFYESPILSNEATVLGLFGIVAVEGVLLMVTGFSAVAMAGVILSIWITSMVRVLTMHDPMVDEVVIAATVYQAILFRFGLGLHRQLAASVQANLVSRALLDRVSTLHERVRSQRDELGGLNLQLAEALQQANDAASHDLLTGALNRRAFLEQAMVERETIRRHGAAACLMILDLDHFKRVNDEHGHQVGDVVLTRVVDAVREHLRPFDVFARWGGEEFIALLPGTALADGLRIAERLRRAVDDVVDTQWPDGLHVTVSIGVTVLSDPDTFDRALAAADDALYSAKSDGRNAVRTQLLS